MNKPQFTTSRLRICALALVLAYAAGPVKACAEFPQPHTYTERVRPLVGQEVERRVAEIDIEGTIYCDAMVVLKCTPHPIFPERLRVKVKVKATSGKKVFSKTLKKSLLFVYPDGQIEVGRGGFCQMLLTAPNEQGIATGKIRHKEGLY